MKNLHKLISGYRNSSADKQRRRGHLACRCEPIRRRLTTESLERRELLAGDVFAHHDPSSQFDVNNDNAISARDVPGVINAIGSSEAAGEPLIELLITAREYGVEPGTVYPFNDDLIAADLNNEINVEVGEVFELEVSYDDLRLFGDRLGAFQLITDVVTSQPNVLVPVLFETQTLIVGQAIGSVPVAEQPNTSITFSIANSPPGKSGDLTFTSTWIAFAQNPQTEVLAALEAFGYTNDEFFLTTPDGIGGDIGSQIRWTDLEYADVDLPNISIEVNEAGSSQHTNLPNSDSANDLGGWSTTV